MIYFCVSKHSFDMAEGFSWSHVTWCQNYCYVIKKCLTIHVYVRVYIVHYRNVQDCHVGFYLNWYCDQKLKIIKDVYLKIQVNSSYFIIFKFWGKHQFKKKANPGTLEMCSIHHKGTKLGMKVNFDPSQSTRASNYQVFLSFVLL